MEIEDAKTGEQTWAYFVIRGEPQWNDETEVWEYQLNWEHDKAQYKEAAYFPESDLMTVHR
jgi:hypothetical protein